MMWKITLGLMFLAVQSMYAEVVFDLGAQQFSNSVKQNYRDATYDTGLAIASTGLAYTNGAYRAKPCSTGSMSVQIKNPKPKWGVTFSMYCYLNDDGCSVTLLGQKGQALNLTFDKNVLAVDGKKSKFYSGNTTINGSVQSLGKQIEVVINGEWKFLVDKPDFALAHVAVQISSSDEHCSNGFENRHDKLNSLAVSSSD